MYILVLLKVAHGQFRLFQQHVERYVTGTRESHMKKCGELFIVTKEIVDRNQSLTDVSW
jgi:hypothetical protein